MEEPKNTTGRQIQERNRDMRRDVLIHRIFDRLEDTVRLRGKSNATPVDDVYVEFTDKSAAYLAPLLEAVGILEDIIFASDGCQGHRNCAHSMEPWQRARALLNAKWAGDTAEGPEWPPAIPAVARTDA